MSGTADARLAVAIVNYEHNREVIAQLQAFLADDAESFAQTEWLVVHNGPGSPPPLESAAAKSIPLARVRVEVTANAGYGAAVNRALALTGAPYLLALNADLLPEPGFLRGVHDLIERQESKVGAGNRVGVIGFRLFNRDGTPQGSVGRFPTLGRFLCGLLRPRRSRKYRAVATQKMAPVAWVTGACVLLCRACLDDIGGFDEQFFMYYEDVDLCRRCQQAGWSVCHDSRLAVRHLHPYHSRELTHRMVYLARHGLLRYFWKHRPRWELWLLARLALLECDLRRFSCRTGPGRQAWAAIAKMIQRFLESPDRDSIHPDELASS